jgi:hypothetical protein
LCNGQLGSISTGKGDGGVALGLDLQAEPNVVKAFGCGQVGRQQDWMDRMVSKH